MEEKEKNVSSEVDEVEDKNNGSTDNTNDGSGSSSEEKTFTQDDVNRMMAREKKQGAQSILNRLGIKKLDAGLEKEIKDYLESKKTDAQKQAEAAVNENKAIEEANNRALAAEIKAEAMQAGAQTQYVDDIVTLIMAKASKESELDVETAISEIKTKYSVWFTSSSEEDAKGKKKPVGEKGTGSSVSSGKDKQDKGKNLGERLAANRRKPSGKKSYWSK